MTESKHLARSTDPQTSKDAAEHAVKSGLVCAQCDLIYSALAVHGPQCAKDLAGTTGLLPHQIMKRLSDLERTGFAVPNGEKVGKQRVWRAVEVSA